MSEHHAAGAARSEEFLRHATTYHRFMMGVKWAMIALASLIGGLTVAYGAGAGPVAGVFVLAVAFSAGVYAMNHGLAHSSERDNGQS